MSRRHFEVCLFSHLADKLKSGDVYVIGSEDYADYREQLLPWEDCKPLIEEYCHNLGFPLDVNDFISHLKSWLEESALSVDKGYPSNTQVIISEQDKPILKRIPKKTDKASLKVLETLIQERISEKSLIDILRNVDYWTNFTRHFNPLSGSEPKLERATERYLLTLFTYGCNLGPTQAARHMDSTITPHMLSFVHRRHISLDKLNAALVDIINRYNVLELPKCWGKGISAAVDGTKYDLYEQNLILSIIFVTEVMMGLLIIMLLTVMWLCLVILFLVALGKQSILLMVYYKISLISSLILFMVILKLNLLLFLLFPIFWELS